MIIENVRKEFCLLFILALAVSVLYSQPISAKGADLETPITVSEVPSLETAQIHLLAGGHSYDLKVNHAVSAVYTLSDTSQTVVSLSNETPPSVTVTPVAAGQTLLSVTAIGSDGAQTVLSCQITVSEL